MSLCAGSCGRPLSLLVLVGQRARERLDLLLALRGRATRGRGLGGRGVASAGQGGLGHEARPALIQEEGVHEPGVVAHAAVVPTIPVLDGGEPFGVRSPIEVGAALDQEAVRALHPDVPALLQRLAGAGQESRLAGGAQHLLGGLGQGGPGLSLRLEEVTVRLLADPVGGGEVDLQVTTLVAGGLTRGEGGRTAIDRHRPRPEGRVGELLVAHRRPRGNQGRRGGQGDADAVGGGGGGEGEGEGQGDDHGDPRGWPGYTGGGVARTEPSRNGRFS